MSRRAAAVLGLAVVGGLGLALYAALAAPDLPVPPRTRFTLHDVQVVNPGQPPVPHQDVRVADGRIERIAPAASPAPGADRPFLLPGLIDMHVHHPPGLLPGETTLVDTLFLRHGVTSVRDVGSVDGSIFRLRDAVDAGRVPGPRIFACGPLLDGAEAPLPARVVETPGDGRRAVARLAERGADCIKVFNYLDAESLAAIRDEAAGRGLPVIGHVPFALRLEDAGLADVQHLTGVVDFEAKPGEPAYQTLTLAWGRIPSARRRAIVAASREQDVAHTPTLVAMLRAAQQSDYEAMRNHPPARWLPRYYRDVFWHPGRFPALRDFDAGLLTAFRVRLQRMQSIVGELHAAGVRIHAGSDCLNPFVVPGASLHEELRLLAGSGMGVVEAWRAATVVPGASLGVADLGRIVEGAPADLVLYARDPTRELDALDSVLGVVSQGRRYEREELDEMLRQLRDHHRGALYDALTTALAGRLFPLR